MTATLSLSPLGALAMAIQGAAMSERGDSDPLPFTQVDRAVKPKAAGLANLIGVRYQDALGCLVEFWDLCGDPRDLERLVEAGKRAVLLDSDAVRKRFLAASGKDIDPEMLVVLGFLEQVGGEGVYRVRGMSRYFDAIEGRLDTRKRKSAAGKASAESRRRSTGTAQPKREALFDVCSNSARTAPEQNPPSVDVLFGGCSNSPEPEVRGQRSEALKETFAGSPPAGAPEPLELAPPLQAAHPKKPKAQHVDPRIAPLTERLAMEYEEARGVPYAHGGAKDTQALKSLLSLGDDDEISARWQWAIKQPITAWCCVSSFAQLRHKWNDIAASANPAAPHRGSLHIVGRHFEGEILRGAS